MPPTAIKATYANIKTVLSRSVCQIVLEIPIEGMEDAMALLGSPKPGSETWVAIARLKSGADAPVEREALPAPRPPLKLAAQAALLCQEPGFQRWLDTDADGAADRVRLKCGVVSRSDLDKDERAARAFKDMRADYKLWLSGFDDNSIGRNEAAKIEAG